jgi:hypothetical protein
VHNLIAIADPLGLGVTAFAAHNIFFVA